MRAETTRYLRSLQKSVLNHNGHIDGLIALFSGIRGAQEYSFDRLKKLVPIDDDIALANLLSKLVDGGFLEQIYRVISPRTNRTIAEFTNFTAIPETISEESTNESVSISPSDISLIYRKLD